MTSSGIENIEFVRLHMEVNMEKQMFMEMKTRHRNLLTVRRSPIVQERADDEQKVVLVNVFVFVVLVCFRLAKTSGLPLL